MEKLLLIAVLLPLGAVIASDLTQTQWLTVAMCRSRCISQYLEDEVSDSGCIGNTACYVCWQMCERVHTPVWSKLCEPSRALLCTDGCRLACDFTSRTSEPSVSLPEPMWVFTEPVTVTVASVDQLVVGWSAPVADGEEVSVSDGVHPVYVAFFQYDDQPDWQLAYMTTELWTTVSGQHEEYVGLVFTMYAVTTDRPAAQVSFPVHYDDVVVKDDVAYDYTESDAGADYDFGADPRHVVNDSDDKKGTEISLTTKHATQRETSTTPATSPDSVKVDMGIRIEDGEGVLRGRLTWGTTVPDGDTPVVFTVTWRRQSCQMHESLPECHLPEQQLVSMAEQINTEEMTMLLPGLTYNSKYELRMTLHGSDVGHLVFYTPRCRNVSDDFSYCLSNGYFPSASLPAVTHKDLDAIAQAGRLPIYATLAVCLVMGGGVVIVTILLLKKQKELRHVISNSALAWKERASSFRSSLRSGASSLRSSVRRMSGRRRYSPARASDEERVSQFAEEDGRGCSLVRFNGHTTVSSKKVSFEMDVEGDTAVSTREDNSVIGAVGNHDSHSLPELSTSHEARVIGVHKTSSVGHVSWV